MSRNHRSGLIPVYMVGVLEQAKLVAKRQEPEDIRTEVCIRPRSAAIVVLNQKFEADTQRRK
jgi:hypothetical protein